MNGVIRSFRSDTTLQRRLFSKLRSQDNGVRVPLSILNFFFSTGYRPSGIWFVVRKDYTTPSLHLSFITLSRKSSRCVYINLAVISLKTFNPQTLSEKFANVVSLLCKVSRRFRKTFAMLRLIRKCFFLQYMTESMPAVANK